MKRIDTELPIYYQISNGDMYKCEGQIFIKVELVPKGVEIFQFDGNISELYLNIQNNISNSVMDISTTVEYTESTEVIDYIADISGNCESSYDNSSFSYDSSSDEMYYNLTTQ